MTEPIISSSASDAAGSLASLNAMQASMSDKCLFLILVPLAILILALTGQKRWMNFALHRKWFSRIILFVLTVVLAIFLTMIRDWAFINVPVHLAYESPNMTAAAVKLGQYGLYIGHEEVQSLPGKELLLRCIDMVSWAEFESHKKNCGDDRACIENIPQMSRETIVTKIKESQGKNIDKVSNACKDVDVTKL